MQDSNFGSSGMLHQVLQVSKSDFRAVSRNMSLLMASQ